MIALILFCQAHDTHLGPDAFDDYRDYTFIKIPLPAFTATSDDELRVERLISFRRAA